MVLGQLFFVHGALEVEVGGAAGQQALHAQHQEQVGGQEWQVDGGLEWEIMFRISLKSY